MKKINRFLLFGLSVLGINSIDAQERKSLTLDEAVHLAWGKSNEVGLANAKVNSKKYELESAKNNQYPDLRISGQYQRLANASINLKSSQNSNSGSLPVVDQLMIGQINVSVPVFAGFRIQNSVQMHENLYEAETASATHTKEEVAMKVINLYASLFKAQKTISLLKENQKRAEQRAFDFSELEKNEIIARNDLLKAQLQVSKIKLSIDEAVNDENIINFQLITLLKLPVGTQLEIREGDFANFKMDNVPTSEQPALENRKDLQAVQLQGKASQANIKLAKGGYYPSINVIGGYVALDLKNVVTVQNAMNFGLGLSYDLSTIFKNGTAVKLAESKATEIQNSEAMLTDYIKIEVQKAIEEYHLAIQQNEVYGQAVAQSSENYRIIKDKYDNGLADTNDLLEADVEQLSANINKTLAKANIIQKYYALLNATGQLTRTFTISKL
ncbi:TolC family protein [Flavobacterium sp.]|uniref:TolC family protein n=1 Tax=Flavobacterium sp. TaxID=239 RepID=UPI0035B022C4